MTANDGTPLSVKEPITNPRWVVWKLINEIKVGQQLHLPKMNDFGHAAMKSITSCIENYEVGNGF